eukprot:361856_1
MDRTSLVLDVGTFATKIGLSSETKPIEERTISVTEIDEKQNSNIVYGNKGINLINRKVKNASINNDINIYENINFLQTILSSNENKTDSILITDSIKSSKLNRQLLTEILFENFNYSKLYYEYSGILGLYSVGRLNGLICDIGYSQTSTIPIIEGYSILSSCNKINFGGKYFDLYFNNLLRKSGITLGTNYQLEIVRDIKETICECRLESSYEKLQDDEEMNCDKYKMPDGTILQIGNARKRSCEILFAPHLLGLQYNGIHKQIINSVQNCDLILRKKLMANITLIGGTTLTKGFPKRLLNELLIDNKNNNRKIGVRIYAPINRQYSAWRGGSILSSMNEFNDEMWINKKQYQEYGKNILFRD